MDSSTQRTTSAGYRFPLSKSRPRSSDFHQQCIPAERRTAAAIQTTDSSNHKETDYAKCDSVTQDTIWKQSVDTEKRAVQQWEENWGFLTEYDPKGNGRPITPEELPQEVTMFSSAVPNTNSGNYGSRLSSDAGQRMQKLEFQFNSHNRKKKLGNDLVCY